MRKFECDDPRFCVVSVAKHHTTCLNREIITLLTSLQAKAPEGKWDPSNAVLVRQEQVLRDIYAKMFVDNKTAMTHLQV